MKQLTPKEKAEKLVEKFRVFAHCPFNGDGHDLVADIDTEIHNAKQCALMAIKFMLEEAYEIADGIYDETYQYWQEVKNEIEKL